MMKGKNTYNQNYSNQQGSYSDLKEKLKKKKKKLTETQNLREFNTTKSALQQMLKDIF